jgi:hypothetical protein
MFLMLSVIIWKMLHNLIVIKTPYIETLHPVLSQKLKGKDRDNGADYLFFRIILT